MDSSSPMNWMDAVVGVLLLAGVIGGAKRGLSGEIARLVVIAAAAFAAWRLGGLVGGLLGRALGLTAEVETAVGTVAVFAAAFAALWALRVMLAKLMHFQFKGRLERVGGAVSGMLRYAVIAAVLLVMLAVAPNPSVRTLTRNSLTGSLLLPRLLPLYEGLQERVPALKTPPVDEIDARGAYGEEAGPSGDVEAVREPAAKSGRR